MTGPAAGPGAAVEPSYVTAVPEPPECLSASPAIVGIKVHLVQRALGLTGRQDKYDADTEAAVREVQAAHGLEVDGVVGPLTWSALGIEEPFCIDRYTAQPVVPLDATPAERIAAMVAYALGKVGTPYIWGAAGPIGFDCSGLALQAMYAAGRTVPGLDTNRHAGADFRTTQYLFTSPALAHAPWSERRRGDLVFYGSPIDHVAIHLGDDRVVEHVRPVARVADIDTRDQPPLPEVVRPFPG